MKLEFVKVVYVGSCLACFQTWAWWRDKENLPPSVVSISIGAYGQKFNYHGKHYKSRNKENGRNTFLPVRIYNILSSLLLYKKTSTTRTLKRRPTNQRATMS